MLVSQIIKDKAISGVVCLGRQARVSEAAGLMAAKRIGTIMVSDDGKTPQGVVSERDIVREVGKRGAGVLDESLGDIMTANPVGCAPGDRAIQVLQTMTEKRFRHMPVLDEAGEMIGLVSIGDVVKGRLDELSAQADALKNMIMGY